MRKRILSIFLSVCLALSLLPTGALAEDNTGAGAKTTLDISKGSITIGADSVSGKDSEGNDVTTANSAGYVITGRCTESDECVTINGAPAGGITLQELTWTGANLQINADVTLDIAGTVTLSTVGVVFSVAAGKTLTLTGSGNLSAVSTASRAAQGAANSDSTYSAKLATRNYTGDLSFKGEVTVMNFSDVDLTTTGALTLDGGSSGTVASEVGTLTLSGKTVTLAGTISVTGTVSVTAATGGITTRSPVYGESVSLTAEDGNISAESTNANPAISTTGGATLSAPKGSISVSSLSGTVGAISVGTGTAELTAGTGIAVTAGACCAVYGKLTASTAAGDISLTSAGAADSNAVSKLATQLTATTGSITLTNSKSGVTPGELLPNGTVLAQKGFFAVVGNPSATYILRTDLLTADANGRYQWSSDQEYYTRCGTDAGKGLDLSSTPTAATCYRAGDGYVRWEPTRSETGVTGGTLVLHNATITNTNGDALFAPGVPVTVTLDAGTTNTLTGTSAGLRANNNLTIGGSGKLAAVGTDAGVRVSNSTLTVMDSADVTASGHSGISADNDITVSDTASVAASGSEFAIQSEKGSVSITSTGAVSAPAVAAKGTFTKGASTVLTGGTLAETHNGKDTDTVRTVYGNYTLSQNMSVKDCSGEDGLTVPAGAKLTIPSGTTLTVEDDTNADGVPQITNNGTLVNNGTIVLPKTYATANGFAGMTAAIKALKFTGTGTVTCGENTYGSDGVRAVTVSDNTALDLSSAPTETTLYTFTKGTALWTPTLDKTGAVTGGTLTLNGATLGAGITFPAGTACVVDTASDSTVSGLIWSYHTGSSTQSLTFRGSGKLTTNGITDSHNDLRFEKGVQVTVNGIVCGKTVTITGSGTKLTVSNQSGEGIEANGVFTLSDGATADLTTDNSGSVLALKSGGGSVTGGSTLKVNGCVGVSNQSDSKFTVDATSTLIANCTCAAVYAEGAENTLSLANLPSDAELQSASYTDSYAGNITFWTLVKKGDKLTVGDYGSVSGALATLTLKPAAVAPSGGGSSSGSTTNTDSKTTTNTDGSTTKTDTTTKTDSTGATTTTEVKTTTNTDGTTTKVETATTKKTDTATGAVTETTTQKTTDAAGKTETVAESKTTVTDKTTGAKTEIVAEAKTTADGTTTKVETVKVAGGKDGVTAEAKVETAKTGEAVATATIEAPATATTTTLPAAVVEAVTKADTANVTVKVGEVSVALDKTAVEAVKATGGEAPVISATPVAAKSLPADLQSATKAYDFKVSGKGVNFGGGSAVVSVPYTKADRAKAIAVYHIDANGNKTRVYDAKLTAGTLNIPTVGWSTYAVLEVAPLAFTDVKDTDWFYGSVQYAVDNNLFKGTSATTFGPNVTMTRGMLVTVLWRMAGSPAMDDYGYPYGDVNAKTNEFAPAIYWARDQKLVNGYSDDKFGPDDAVTREQMVSILYRYAALKKYSVSGASELTAFTDAANVSSYATAAVKWAVGAKLLTGSDGKLNPASGATRAEVAAILMRFGQKLAK